MPQQNFDETMKRVFDELDRVAPGAPLVACGQSVFWDEPMKRVLLEARDHFGSDRPAMVGLHDLDYFSRMPDGNGDGYSLLPHNDVDTRDIWCAAGEMSALFGSEVWASRERLNKLGLRLNVALGPDLEGLGPITEAWGWRGVVLNGGDAPVVRDLPAERVVPAFRELLEWGFETSAAMLVGEKAKRRARSLGRRILDRLDSVAASHGAHTASDVLLGLVPFMWSIFDDTPPPEMTPTRTSDIFRFNSETVGLPRFDLLRIFLDPQTAETAHSAYDKAVRGAPMYALEEFGAGAIPFDLYVPGRGRGTLFVLDGYVVAHTTPRTVVEYQGSHISAEDLARAIEDRVGPGSALLGKAVSLAAMLSHEFVFVLNETGSAYMPRTATLIRGLREAGIEFPVHPVVRIEYRTWDALKVVDAAFELPEHLAQAFGSASVAAEEFARKWHAAAREQCSLLRRLEKQRGVADILNFLGFEEQEEWFHRLREYQAAEERLLRIQRDVAELKRKAQELRERNEAALEDRRRAERLCGKINRQRLRPLKRKLAVADDEEERRRLEREIEEVGQEHAAAYEIVRSRQEERRRLRAKRRALTETFRNRERDRDAREARQVLGRVERMAERQRLKLARNAILACKSLQHTQVRPSAWWLPLVDPSGAWYAEIRRSAQARLEWLDAAD